MKGISSQKGFLITLSTLIIIGAFFIPTLFKKDLFQVYKTAATFTTNTTGDWNDADTWGLGSVTVTFDSSVGINIDPTTGEIYFVSAGNNAFIVLNSDHSPQFFSDDLGLFSPRVSAIAPSGKIYITDTGNHRLAVLNADFSFDTFIADGTLYNGVALNDPESVSISSAGYIYITDTNNARIVVLNPDNSASTTYESIGLDIPTYLTFASSGEMYIANQNNNTISILNPDGTASTTIPLGFSPWAMRFSPNGTGEMYVTDTTNNLIVILNPDGSASTTFNGDTFAPLGYPTNIAFGLTGELYISDHNNDRIVVLNQNGTASTSIASGALLPQASVEGSTYPGINDDVVINTSDIVLTQNQNVKNITLASGGTLDLNGFTLNVSGNWTNSGGTLTSNGGTINLVGTTTQSIFGENEFYNLTKIATTTSTLLFDKNATTTITNNLILTGALSNLLTIGMTGTSSVESYHSEFGSSGSGDGQFNIPIAVSKDSLGNLYVLDRDNNRVQKFDSTGVYISQFGTGGSGNGEISNAHDMFIDASDNIYIADTDNNRIQKFDSNGVYVSQFGTAGSGNGEFSSPKNVTLDSSGNIYVADTANNRIQIFDSNGTYISQFGTTGTGNGEFTVPTGVAIDTLGNIYVTDADNQRIQKFDSNGSYLLQFGSSGSGDSQFVYPINIAFNSSGDMYVTDYLNHRVQKFDTSGNYISQFGTNGSGNGQFQTSYGLYVDSDDNIYVTDLGNNRVQKFIPPTSVDAFTILKTGTGLTSLEYLSISNSNNISSGSFACYTGCVNGGGNVNWGFTAPNVSVSSAPSAVGPISIFIKKREVQQVTPVVSSTTENVVQVVEKPVIQNIVIKDSFIKNLGLGMRSDDVKKLQIFLNAHGFQIAKSGVGSKGQETGYFGAATKAAVVRLQESYMKDILDPLKLEKGTGFFGPYTRKTVNKLLSE